MEHKICYPMSFFAPRGNFKPDFNGWVQALGDPESALKLSNNNVIFEYRLQAGTCIIINDDIVYIPPCDLHYRCKRTFYKSTGLYIDDDEKKLSGSVQYLIVKYVLTPKK